MSQGKEHCPCDTYPALSTFHLALTAASATVLEMTTE